MKLLSILKEIQLTGKRSHKERQERYKIALEKKIKQYIKDGGQGDLNLEGAPITFIPSGLEVGGNLNLSKTKITSLPDGLKVDGNLNLSDTKITLLPLDLKVGGSLNLANSSIKSLPDGLEVGGHLNLTVSRITSLPRGLKVGGLSLWGRPITSLPSDLQVGDSLDLKDTPIEKNYTEKEIRKMLRGYKGVIYMYKP